MCLRGSRLRSRFQSSNLVQLCDECRSFIIFAGRPSVTEGASDSDDLFNLADVCVAAVDGITHSGDGGEDCLIGDGIICDGDGCLGSSKRCVNGGTTTWNFLYGGWYVLLVGVVELAGGFVWVREVFVSKSVEGWPDECLAYWIRGNI